MKYILIITTLTMLISSCTKLRESAGVTRKSLDEFAIIENPPLVIPPDFNLLPPDKIEKKEIEDTEKELAEEILFGLSEEELDQNINSSEKKLSTINHILDQTEANDINSNIRKEIDQQFANEVKTTGILGIGWESDDEILDAIEESNKLRNNLETDELIVEKEDQKKEEKKQKKKKRFFFF